MRKAIKTLVIIGLVLALVLGLASTAFAAGSKEGVVDITDVTDESGNKDNYTNTDVNGGAYDGYTPLTIPIAARVTGQPESDFSAVLPEMDLTADKLPATFTFSVDAPNGTPVYVFHYNAEIKDWEFISKGAAPTVAATFSKLSPVGFVLGQTQSGPAPTEPDNPSPATGDNANIGLWAGILAVAAIGAVGTVVYGKKREKRS